MTKLIYALIARWYLWRGLGVPVRYSPPHPQVIREQQKIQFRLDQKRLRQLVQEEKDK